MEELRITLISQGYLRSDVDRVIGIMKEKSKKEQEERVIHDVKKQEALQSFQQEEVKRKGFFGRLFG